jgi:hypothetical protein
VEELYRSLPPPVGSYRHVLLIHRHLSEDAAWEYRARFAVSIVFLLQSDLIVQLVRGLVEPLRDQTKWVTILVTLFSSLQYIVYNDLALFLALEQPSNLD